MHPDRLMPVWSVICSVQCARASRCPYGSQIGASVHGIPERWCLKVAGERVSLVDPLALLKQEHHMILDDWR